MPDQYAFGDKLPDLLLQRTPVIGIKKEALGGDRHVSGLGQHMAGAYLKRCRNPSPADRRNHPERFAVTPTRTDGQALSPAQLNTRASAASTASVIRSIASGVAISAGEKQSVLLKPGTERFVTPTITPCAPHSDPYDVISVSVWSDRIKNCSRCRETTPTCPGATHVGTECEYRDENTPGAVLPLSLGYITTTLPNGDIITDYSGLLFLNNRVYRPVNRQQQAPVCSRPFQSCGSTEGISMSGTRPCPSVSSGCAG